MLFKKISAAAAALLGCAVISVSASAETVGNAWVCAADETWDMQYWGSGNSNNKNIASAVDAEITGDGIYTVSAEFANAISYGQYFAIGTDFAALSKKPEDTLFADYADAELSIISVKADGVEISGNTAVCDMNYYDTMAVYIYNPWEDEKYSYTQNLDWSAGITSIEVTFEIKGLGFKAENSVINEDSSSQAAAEADEDLIENDNKTVAEQPSETADKKIESKPLPDSATKTVNTGNLPVSFSAITALCSGTAAFLSFKKKK